VSRHAISEECAIRRVSRPRGYGTNIQRPRCTWGTNVARTNRRATCEDAACGSRSQEAGGEHRDGTPPDSCCTLSPSPPSSLSLFFLIELDLARSWRYWTVDDSRETAKTGPQPGVRKQLVYALPTLLGSGRFLARCHAASARCASVRAWPSSALSLLARKHLRRDSCKFKASQRDWISSLVKPTTRSDGVTTQLLRRAHRPGWLPVRV